MTETKCCCMKPSPIVQPFGETFVVLCRGCGGNLTEKCAPTSQHRLASDLGYALELAGNAFLGQAERTWLNERRKRFPAH